MTEASNTHPLRAATVPAMVDVPGLVCGFERRLGPPGWEARPESRRRVAEALRPSGRLLLLKQVHGAAVLRAPWDGEPEGDAAVVEEPGFLLGIETADCLPVFLVDPRRSAAAAAHAGWRGTAARVAVHALEALLDGGSKAEDIVAALGPCIGPCCYEVGDDLRDVFGPGGAGFFHPRPRGRPHLDVRAANLRQLAEAGVPRSQIHSVDECTSCQADAYHSYRREGKGAGRMINYVGWRG